MYLNNYDIIKANSTVYLNSMGRMQVSQLF